MHMVKIQYYLICMYIYIYLNIIFIYTTNNVIQYITMYIWIFKTIYIYIHTYIMRTYIYIYIHTCTWIHVFVWPSPISQTFLLRHWLIHFHQGSESAGCHWHYHWWIFRAFPGLAHFREKFVGRICVFFCPWVDPI